MSLENLLDRPEMRECDGRTRQRIGAVSLQLSSRVGDVHPRLKHEDQRRTMGDHNAAVLTYAQIMLNDAPDTSYTTLPSNALKAYDGHVKLSLVEGHLRTIDEYLENGTLRFFDKETLAGYPVIEHGPLHPIVEGYEWYRGYCIPVAADAAVLLYTPWMTPTKPGGSPPPAMYRIGQPPVETMREIAGAYAQTMAPYPESQL